MDEYYQAVRALPTWLAAPLAQLPVQTAMRIQELRLRTGCAVTFTVQGRQCSASALPGCPPKLAAIRLNALQIEEIFHTLCNGSVHTHERELAEGYLTTAVGNRVGVAGQFVQREGQCIALQKVTSFNLRIARSCVIPLPPALDKLLEQHFTGLLVVGEPGSGKTTTAMRLKDYLENLGVTVCLLSMDNFFLPLDQRPPEATDWESPYCVNVDLLVSCISRLLDGKEVDIPWYDFKSGSTGGYKKMQGEKGCIVIAEGIHMLNPLIFDKIRGAATGIYVAPRTRILTNNDRVVRPEQLRVARRLIRDYNTRGHSLRETVERAESVNRGEVNYIKPYKGNAAIHIDSFHDYEPCILTKCLSEIPNIREELTAEYLQAHDLTDLIDVVETVPPLHTPFVPRNSIVREFVGGSCYEY